MCPSRHLVKQGSRQGGEKYNVVGKNHTIPGLLRVAPTQQARRALVENLEPPPKVCQEIYGARREIVSVSVCDVPRTDRAPAKRSF